MLIGLNKLDTDNFASFSQILGTELMRDIHFKDSLVDDFTVTLIVNDAWRKENYVLIEIILKLDYLSGFRSHSKT